MSEVSLERTERRATITLRRPEKLNALDDPAVTALNGHLQDVQYDEDVRCVVITGEGESFCAGADLSEQLEDGPADVPSHIERRFHETVLRIMRMKKPVIAEVGGPAAGAGACVATACDFAYASEEAKLGWVFANIGLALDSGASFILPRLVGLRTAMELVTSGDIVGAAAEMGLVNDVFPAGELSSHVDERARELGSGPTLAYGAIKRAMLRGSHRSLEQTLDSEALNQTVLFETDDREEGRRAFLEDREPAFEGR